MAFLALYLKAYDFYAPHNSELFVKGQKSRNAQSTFSNNLIQWGMLIIENAQFAQQRC